MNNNRCARTTRKVHQTLKGLILYITGGSTRQSTKTYFLFSYSLAASFLCAKSSCFRQSLRRSRILLVVSEQKCKLYYFGNTDKNNQ